MTDDRSSVINFLSILGIFIAAIATAVFSPTVFAQSSQQILEALDADNDGAISKSEARDNLKQNFALIDANGDGGIDAEELDRVLKMMAAQNDAQAQEGDSAAPSPGGDPSFGTLNPNAASFMNVPPDQDNMFYMLNLMKYQDKAKYADGRETNLTGEEADRLYNPLPEVEKVGGGLVYAGGVEAQLVGKDPTWDRVGIVMYPSRAKIQQMRASAGFQETVVHKGPSLAASQIIVTIPEEAWTYSDEPPIAAADVPHPASADDPSFTLFQLVKYRDVAEYPEGSSEPKRSGREAMDMFWKSLAGILHEAGVTPMLKAEVDGVLVGDGRDWDDYRILRFPSRRAYEAVLTKIESSDFAIHFTAAVEDEYRLQLADLMDRTANPPTPPK